jgi:N-acetyl-anhydromuramyl-L-alanine amidase AmpD
VGALLVGAALVGSRVLRHRLHLPGPRTVWRRLVTHDPTGIVIHHSDTPGIVHGHYVGAAFIDRTHQRRGFGIRYRGKVYHIGYHYVIREDGVIEPGRPEHCMGAHSKTHNDYLGICLVGDFSSRHNRYFWRPSRPTPAQLHSLVWLCERLMAKYDIPPDQVVRHSDVRETECPGDRFPFAWLQQEISRPKIATTERGRSGATGAGPRERTQRVAKNRSVQKAG